MRPKSLILIVIALGCGLVASIGISQVIENQNSGKQTVKAPTEQIYVAIADVPLGEPLNAQMVQLEEWPKDKIPEGAIRKFESLEDRRPLTRLYPGEPILRAKLLDASKFYGASEKIPKGMRVVSVKVTLDSSASGLIHPGDRVDVLVFLKRGRGISATMTKTIMKNVTVFAVNERTQREIDEDGASVRAKTVSLLVSPHQVERIMLASELGKIKLSLRQRDDDTENVADGATIADLDTDTTEQTDKPWKGDADKVESNDPGGIGAFLREMGGADGSVASEPQWVMHLHTPQDVRVYNWDDADRLPRELTQNVPAAPTAPQANRESYGDFDDSGEGSGQVKFDKEPQVEVEPELNMSDTEEAADLF